MTLKDLLQLLVVGGAFITLGSVAVSVLVGSVLPTLKCSLLTAALLMIAGDPDPDPIS